MAYCRFSSDNFKSDVYCYYSASGYLVMVANNRITSPIPEASLHSMFVDGDPQKGTTEATLSAWSAQNKLHNEALDAAVRAPIGLPEDGNSYTFDYPEEAVAYLKELREMGYHVPEQAFLGLQEEVDLLINDADDKKSSEY